jgi:hypothetical protein
MVEYQAKDGKIIITKAKELNLKEILVDESSRYWHKISPDSFIIRVECNEPTYLVSERDKVVLKSKAIVIYNVKGKDDISLMRKLQECFKENLDVLHNPSLPKIVEDVTREIEIRNEKIRTSSS